MLLRDKEISTDPSATDLDIGKCIVEFQKRADILLNETQLKTIGEYIIYAINSILDVYQNSLPTARGNLQELIKATQCIGAPQKARDEYLSAFRRSNEPKTDRGTAAERWLHLYLYDAIDFFAGENSKNMTNIAKLGTKTNSAADFAQQMQQFIVFVLQKATALTEPKKIAPRIEEKALVPSGPARPNPKQIKLPPIKKQFAEASEFKPVKIEKRERTPTIPPSASVFKPFKPRQKKISVALSQLPLEPTAAKN